MWRFAWTMLSRTGAVAFAGFVAWQAWDTFGPRLPDIGPQRRQVVDEVMPRVVDALARARQTNYSAALLPLVNDSSGYVTDCLRQQIEQKGVLDLRDRSFVERVEKKLRVRHNENDTLENALYIGKSLGVQAVLYGRVVRHEVTGHGPIIQLDLHLADVAEGKETPLSFSHEVGGMKILPAAMLEAADQVSWGKRLAGWILLAMLLPMFSMGFIRAMVRKESNRVNGVTLGVYTVVDLILAWLFLGALLSSAWGVLIFLLLVAIAFLYNISVMTYAVRMES